MSTQSADEVWLEGVKAFEAGTKRDANPYTKQEASSWKSISWYGGWDTASLILHSKPINANVD